MSVPKARSRRPTITDIARQAGVSVSAVSYALNGQPGVSERTRAADRGDRPGSGAGGPETRRAPSPASGPTLSGW